MPFTAAQRTKVAAKLLLFRASLPVLPVPVNTDKGTVAGELGTRMKSVAALARFKKISFGVVDFTADPDNPKVFMHQGPLAWRMGSSGKIAALLAAAQLRADVRIAKEVLDADGIALPPQDYDQLFATIWAASPHSYVKEISKGVPPRVSTLFDFSKPRLDFLGADAGIDRRLGRVDGTKDLWLSLPAISILNRLWLMGAQSDNISSTSCISEIGVAYMKAVQKAYGLWLPDRTKGMHMLLAEGYWHIPSDIPKAPVHTGATAPKHRQLRDGETNPVKDVYPGAGSDSFQAGSVAALVAYMIALVQDQLVDKDGCDAIKLFLADGHTSTLPGSLFQGVAALFPAVTIKTHAKGGALKAPPSQNVTLRSDLAYMETVGSKPKKFALVAMGLVEVKDGANTFAPAEQGRALAQAIHAALIA